MKIGKSKNGSNDFFGERPYYVETVNGVDTQIANNDKYLQLYSGYKQYDFMQKLVFQQNNTTNHSLNFQYSTSSDIPRYSGAVGIVNNASKKTKIAFNLASAYRVPNIDDLSKIFESVPGTLIVPNNNLNPEKSITADLSITFWNGNRFQFENTFYHTRLFDPIVTDTFTLNGQSTLIYEGQESIILANQNQGKGQISGVSSTLKTYITKALLFYGTFNYSQGRVKNAKGEFPLDHIAPIYGKTGFKYENKFVTFDLFMLYNGNKNLKDYSPSGEDNLQYAPNNGMPAWETYNLICSLSVIKNLTIFSGIENILDTQYRTFSSGINAGGRNIYLGGKYVL